MFDDFRGEKYSAGQFQVTSMMLVNAELGKDVWQHTIIKYLHHAETMATNNHKITDNSKKW